MISIATAMSFWEPTTRRRTASVGIPVRPAAERTRSSQWLLIWRVIRSIHRRQRLGRQFGASGFLAARRPTALSVTGTLAIKAAATYNVAISKVEFYRDNNVLLTTDTSSPYTFNWNSTTVTQGAHTLYAIAQDTAGLRTTSVTIAITVDNTAPTVAITSPANNAKVQTNSIVNINANASDNFGVVKVDFFVGTTLTCTITSAPYTCVWQVPNQRANFHLKATAHDVAGKTTTHTISVSSR